VPPIGVRVKEYFADVSPRAVGEQRQDNQSASKSPEEWYIILCAQAFSLVYAQSWYFFPRWWRS
jgi:hypothetical protein